MCAAFLQQSGESSSQANRESLRTKSAVAQRRCEYGGGFAMLEVLITLVILLIGLLGLAGVVARSNAAVTRSMASSAA